jgi:hypothetical protein
VDDNAANGQEPNHHPHDLFKTDCIFPHLAVDPHLVQEIDADIEIENSRDTDGTEEAHKCSLLEFFNLADLLVHGEYDGDAAEEQD